MKIRIVQLLTFFSLYAFVSLSAQDVVFSQFYGNPIYLNPALAGNKIAPRVTLNYRNEWPQAGDGYVSYNAGCDMYMYKLHGALAVQTTADMSNAIKVYSASGIYSYRVQLTEKTVMNLGLEAGYIQCRLDWDKLIFEDQLKNRNGDVLPPTQESVPTKLNVGNVDLSTGAIFGYNERAYFGVAVHHLNRPNISFYQDAGSASANRLHPRITIHGGALFDFRSKLEHSENERLSIAPTFVYIRQGKFNQLNVGSYVNIYPLVLGAWFRHTINNSDAAIVLVGLLQPHYKIGYSYDYTVSRLTNRSGGSHEISFAWLIPMPKKEFKIKTINSPTF